MDSLLGKIRNLNTVFRQSFTSEIPVDELCKKLSTVLSANIYLFEPNGSIFSYATADQFYCELNEDSLKNHFLPQSYMDFFESNDETQFNFYEEYPLCTCEGVDTCIFKNRYYSMVPVFYNLQKKAGILLIRYGYPFTVDEEALCEYTSAIVSLELMRVETQQLRRQSLKMARAQLAAEALSYSELIGAVEALSSFEPGASDGIVMLNAVSAAAFVTHSTVSSALKKLETAGVIKTKSMGVKGKYIQIINPYLMEELAKSTNSP